MVLGVLGVLGLRAGCRELLSWDLIWGWVIIEFISSDWHEEIVNAEACRKGREKDPNSAMNKLPKFKYFLS